MNLAERQTLLSIAAVAKSGAAERAWRLLIEAGLDASSGDPAAATLRGRLLKDRALRSLGIERQRLFGEAAAAYLFAAADGLATYPLINAATLSQLAGDEGRAQELAQGVLDRIAAHPDEPETPYYLSATRAEALLLLYRYDDAEAAFSEAIVLAPRAWEDHASTLRQFGLILKAQGRDASWLDTHRPPRSLHFGGHMSFDPAVAQREQLDAKIAAVLDEERVGFGYGALAAGADIIVAEALLAHGAALHAVLPGGVESFASVSVDPFGEAWRARFDVILAQAETVRVVRPFDAPPDAITIGLADEIAMGAAALNARRLESRAVQLLVLDEAAAEHYRGRAGRSDEAEWHRRIVTAPRETQEAESAPTQPAASRARLAVLAVALGRGTEGEIGARLADLGALLDECATPTVPPHFTGAQVVFGYPDVVGTARAAMALNRRMESGTPLGIGGHYGIAGTVDDPFGGQTRVVGEAAGLAAGAAASAPPGAVCVTEDFAAALAASGANNIYAEYIGELEGGGAPVGLFALKLLL